MLELLTELTVDRVGARPAILRPVTRATSPGPPGSHSSPPHFYASRRLQGLRDLWDKPRTGGLLTKTCLDSLPRVSGGRHGAGAFAARYQSQATTGLSFRLPDARAVPPSSRSA